MAMQTEEKGTKMKQLVFSALVAMMQGSVARCKETPESEPPADTQPSPEQLAKEQPSKDHPAP